MIAITKVLLHWSSDYTGLYSWYILTVADTVILNRCGLLRFLWGKW